MFAFILKDYHTSGGYIKFKYVHIMHASINCINFDIL